MTLENATGFKTFQATAVAIAVATRVVVDATGKIAAAAATDMAVGVTMEAVAASGYGLVKLFSAPGTFLMTASGAITAGVVVFPAASGKIASAGTTALTIQALEAATANGDIIECMTFQKGA